MKTLKMIVKFSKLLIVAALTSGQAHTQTPVWNYDFEKIPSFYSNFVVLIPVGPYTVGENKIWDTARLFAQVGSLDPYFSETKLILPFGKGGRALHISFDTHGLLVVPACRLLNLAPVFLKKEDATRVTLVGKTILDLLKGSENCKSSEPFSVGDILNFNQILDSLPEGGDYSKYNFSLAPGAEKFLNPFNPSSEN